MDRLKVKDNQDLERDVKSNGIIIQITMHMK